MNSRIPIPGVIAGLFASAALWPALYLQLPGTYIEGWFEPAPVLSAGGIGAAAVAVFASGAAAVRWGHVSGTARAIGAGGLAGLVATAVAWVLIVGPAVGVYAHGELFQTVPVADGTEEQLKTVLARAIIWTFWFGYGGYFALNVLGAAIGAFGGLVASRAGAFWGQEPRQAVPSMLQSAALSLALMIALCLYVMLAACSTVAANINEIGVELPHSWSAWSDGVFFVPVLSLMAALAFSIALTGLGATYTRPYERLRGGSITTVALAVLIGLFGLAAAVVLEPDLATHWAVLAGDALIAIAMAAAVALNLTPVAGAEEPAGDPWGVVTGSVLAPVLWVSGVFGLGGISVGLAAALGSVSYIDVLTSGADARLGGATPLPETVQQLFYIHGVYGAAALVGTALAYAVVSLIGLQIVKWRSG